MGNAFADVRLGYRLLMAVDVERYSARSALEQLSVQRELGRALDVAAARSGLDRGIWRRQVSGDGELAVLPADTDVAHVVGTFTERLREALTELNYERSVPPRLRMRLAFHHGTVASGPFGPAGDAPVVVSRLLDADPLREALTERRDENLVLAVSDTLFADVVSTGFCDLDPADFALVEVVAKGTAYRGHLYRGGEAARTAPLPLHSLDAAASVPDARERGPAQWQVGVRPYRLVHGVG